MAPLLDPDVLSELHVAVGDELHAILTTFTTLLTELAPRVTAHATDGRVDEAGALAHQLKGAAGNVGAAALAEAARAVEQAARAGDRTALAASAQGLGPLADQTIAALVAWRAGAVDAAA